MENDDIRVQETWMKIKRGIGICSGSDPDKTRGNWISLPVDKFQGQAAWNVGTLTIMLSSSKNFFVGPSGNDTGDLQACESCDGLKIISDSTQLLLPELERVCREQAQKTSAM